jgi:hypothetical protein
MEGGVLMFTTFEEDFFVADSRDEIVFKNGTVIFEDNGKLMCCPGFPIKSGDLLTWVVRIDEIASIVDKFETIEDIIGALRQAGYTQYIR